MGHSVSFSFEHAAGEVRTVAGAVATWLAKRESQVGDVKPARENAWLDPRESDLNWIEKLEDSGSTRSR